MRPEAGLHGVRNYTFSLPSASSPFLRFLISFSIPPAPPLSSSYPSSCFPHPRGNHPSGVWVPHRGRAYPRLPSFLAGGAQALAKPRVRTSTCALPRDCVQWPECSIMYDVFSMRSQIIRHVTRFSFGLEFSSGLRCENYKRKCLDGKFGFHISGREAFVYSS